MKYNLQPSLLSGAVLVCALGVMWLGHFLSNLQPDTMVVRKLDIAVTPPPPPPPKTQNVVEETELVMQVEGSGAAMTMADLSVEPDIQVPKPDMPNVKVTQTQWDMPDIELDAFGLSELDSKPTLLTPVKIRFPKLLKKQGIKRVIVKLDVIPVKLTCRPAIVPSRPIKGRALTSTAGTISRFVSSFSPSRTWAISLRVVNNTKICW